MGVYASRENVFIQSEISLSFHADFEPGSSFNSSSCCTVNSGESTWYHDFRKLWTDVRSLLRDCRLSCRVSVRLYNGSKCFIPNPNPLQRVAVQLKCCKVVLHTYSVFNCLCSVWCKVIAFH